MIKKSIVVIIGLMCIWQLIVYIFRLPEYLLPGPLEVFRSVWLYRGLLCVQAWPTIVETLIGLFFGVLLGASMSLTMILFNPVRYWMMPVLILSQAIPTFVFAPLLVIWLGYGLSSKVAITIFALFFPVASAFFDGLMRTRTGWLDLAETMEGSRWRKVWFIRIPAALPAFASGIKVATAWAPMAAVIGEWVGASEGLGYLMLDANARVDINLVFAALIVLVVFSLTLYFVVDRALKFLIPWANEL
jgi:putative hydroxymethylpyrimidine transport system permease protein